MAENHGIQPRFSLPAEYITVPFCPTKDRAGGAAETIVRRGCFRPFRVIKKIIFLTLINLD
jgi:hypothetical protein